MVIANTIKGKGISFMENKVLWHYRPPDVNDLKKGLMELENIMRNFFISELVKEAKKNKKIVLVVGDLGFSVVEPLKKNFQIDF